MYINDVIQLNIILYSVGCGAIIALLYDIYTAINKAIADPHNMLVLKDIIFCFLSAFICFIFLLVINKGRMRIYMLPSMIAGFCCWHFSFSAILIEFLHKIFTGLMKFFHLSAKILILPFKPIYYLFSFVGEKLYEYFKKYFIKLKNKLKIHLKKI